MSPSMSSKVADYLVLPLRIPPISSFPNAPTHFIYLRPHEPRIPELDSPRSLFLVNIPFDSTDIHLRYLFSDQLGGGRIERVEFEASQSPKLSTFSQQDLTSSHKKRKRAGMRTEGVISDLPQTWDRELQPSGGTAVAVFVDKPSMELTLKAVKKATKTGVELLWGKGIEERLSALGSQRYLTHHALRYPSKGDLQTAVDTYMTNFVAIETARSDLLARQRQVPDDDGFVTVTRGGRTGPARVEEAQEKLEQLKKKEQDKRDGMSDFYRFQVRERKKQKAGELLKKFEEDRKRFEEMRKQKGRRFRPI